MIEFTKEDGTTALAQFIPVTDKETFVFFLTGEQSFIIDEDGTMIPCSTSVFGLKPSANSFKLDAETEDKIYHLNCSACRETLQILFPKHYR